MNNTNRTKSALLVCGLILSLGWGGIAQAGVISLTETFDEFGTRTTSQNGFNWQFNGLAPSAGDLTITFDWVRMDFDGSGEYMDIFAEGSLLGRIGNSSAGECVTATGSNGTNFFSDCTGSLTFSGVASALLADGVLSLTSTQNGVNSSGGAPGSPFGYISATLSYDMVSVPEPSSLALVGLGLLGLGLARRKRA